jgi:hypothetical protein
MLDQERVAGTERFDLAINRKLRGCDLVQIRIGDLVAGGRVRTRAMAVQQKTKRPVQFELLEPARSSWRGSRDDAVRSSSSPSLFALTTPTTLALDNTRDLSTSG